MGERARGAEGQSEYDELLKWARERDLDACEREAARLMPLPEIESEWSAAPALRVGPSRGWVNCRKIIRALDAELIEIDARAELRQMEADGEPLEAGRARALRLALGALREVRSATRLDDLWERARAELALGERELREWLGPEQGARKDWPDRLEGVSSLPGGPWPRARASAGWALDGLRADPARAGQALSVLEREALLSVTEEGRDQARGGGGRL